MKANVEAYQLGHDTGWEDGYYDRQPTTEFNFPDNWSPQEKTHYIKGYREGFEEGSRNS